MASNRPKTILDEYKLRMSAKPLAQGAKPPSLIVNIYRNNPQLTVFTGHDNGSGITMISAGMDARTWYTVCELVNYYADSNTPAGKTKIENKAPIPAAQRTDPKVKLKVTSETWIGKDEDGKVWISIVHGENQQAPKIQFYFGVDYYHSIKTREGDGFVSQISARAWVRLFSDLVSMVMHSNGVDPQNQNTGASTKSQGSGKSNYSKSNTNSGGSADSFEDSFDANFDDDF